ncbi:chromate transporter [Bacillus sp. PK3_68]|uniref:chromate transporter n=1 Tax=Bacillus sp. PK3_68 TaxID=2027408 RepID=UPI000E753E7A|nr:chromate transporter [Bacillus sp. PK3_68]RJS61219.1 ChrA protein [Bacillus sp. PK3_68]
MTIINEKSNEPGLLNILLVSLRLGFTSFGGPIAHLGYFHEEYVRRRKWLNEKDYADLVALCQFLPGPASSQVGIGIGVIRAGIPGGIVAFIGFTLPSVLALILFALVLQNSEIKNAGWVHGLKLVAVAVVAHAVAGMAAKLTPDLYRKTISLFSLTVTLLWQTAFAQVLLILISALAGYLLYKQSSSCDQLTPLSFPLSRRFGAICLSLFLGLLIALPLLREALPWNWLAMMDSFYRAGSLVFGGGHVVLPLLEREFVPGGWLSEAQFLTGYGATQAVPGPLFTFSAYIGTVISGWKGGLLATFAIFLPAFLLILGSLPFWDSLRRNQHVQGALMGVNAAVVGILTAALYDPIWTSAILKPSDFALAAILFSMLAYWKLPPWIVVLAGSIGGLILPFVHV